MLEARRGQDQPPAAVLHDRVLDVRPDRQGEVRRKRPGCRRPGQEDLVGRRAGVIEEFEADRDGRVLAVEVDVVHPCLGVAERRLTAPAVGENLEPLVDQALVPQRPKRPHDTLHVVEVERLVVVLEVDPAGLTGDVALPLGRVAQHARAAGVVEVGDPERRDLRMSGDAELALRLDLGGQPVTVPSESSVDDLAAHRLIPRHGVLHETGEQVAVVRKPIGERWAVVEHVLVSASFLATHDRLEKCPVPVPGVEDPRFKGREVGLRVDVRVAHCSDSCGCSFRKDDVLHRCSRPRSHPACLTPQCRATRFRRR